MYKKLLKTLTQAAGAFFLITASTSLEAWEQYSFDSHMAADLHGSSLLTLEDGSEWKVAESDQNRLDWWYTQRSAVPINITPNYSSSRSHYGYYITNQSTGSYVRANLVTAPIRGNSNAVTITGFDKRSFDRTNIYLSNGTFWRVSSQDSNLIANWYVDDLIIVGKNSEWFTYSTHILINIHTNTFVRVERI